jgi:phage pi2 protein 07
VQKERIKLDKDIYNKIINDEFDDWNMINFKFTNSSLSDGVCDVVVSCEDIIKNLHKKHGVPPIDVAKARGVIGDGIRVNNSKKQ